MPSGGATSLLETFEVDDWFSASQVADALLAETRMSQSRIRYARDGNKYTTSHPVMWSWLSDRDHVNSCLYLPLGGFDGTTSARQVDILL